MFDIDDRKRADIAMREARDLAEEANRAKDVFLAMLSHELRTPLSAILGWAQLLRSEKLDAAKALEAADAIETSGRAQAALINDLLDVSRIVAGKMELDTRPLDLGLGRQCGSPGSTVGREGKGDLAWSSPSSHRYRQFSEIRYASSKSRRTCFPTRSSSRRPAARSMSCCAPQVPGWNWSCATPAWASPPIFFPTCLIALSRSRPPPPAEEEGWDSGWPSCETSSNCMAEP